MKLLLALTVIPKDTEISRTPLKASSVRFRNCD